MDKLLSITDENAILITAEFVDSGIRMKPGNVFVRRNELDLIVKNDITVGKLLLAIQAGLKIALWDLGCTEYEPIPVSQYDNRFPLLNRSQDLPENTKVAEEENKKSGKPKSLLRRLPFFWKKPADEQLDEKTLQDTPDNTDEKQSEPKTEAEKKREAYKSCLDVFEACYHFFKQPNCGYNEGGHPDPRRFVIGVGSVNYSAFQRGDLLADSDTLQIQLTEKDEGKKLKDVGFITSTRIVFDPVGWHHSGPLFDPEQIIQAFKENVPEYNISERPLQTLDSAPVHIIPPTEVPQKSKQNLLSMVLSPLLMTGAMVGMRLLSTSGSGSSLASSGMMFGGMGMVSVVVALVNARIRNKEHKASVAEWRTQYQSYVQRLIQDIKKKQENDVALLQQLYPPVLQPERDDSRERDKETSELQTYVGNSDSPIVPVLSERVAKANEKEPETNDLISKALRVDGGIFSRSKEHPDFLKIRVGVSTKHSELVPSVFEIAGEKKETVFASIKYQNIEGEAGRDFQILLPEDPKYSESDTLGYLVNLPADIAKKYAYLDEAPVLLSLLKCRCLGLVLEGDYDYMPFLSNIIFDLCFYHSPDDVQIVMLCEPCEDLAIQQEIIRRYKHLPHFRELLGNISAFAFDKEHANRIFNRLLEIMSARREKEKDGKYPNIIVIALHEHSIKNHPISEYLPVYGEDEKEGYGISFIFCKRYQEELPRYCEYIIMRSERGAKSNWLLLPHTQIITPLSEEEQKNAAARYGFIPDASMANISEIDHHELFTDFHRAFKALSALHYERIAQGANVPERVELLDILGNSKSDNAETIQGDLKNFIRSSWQRSNSPGQADGQEDQLKAVESLAVPIGADTEEFDKPVELDLHEKADGPHMLVAGTTGSGKTETVLSYLISLCATYSPEQVNLLLIDMKGAGFVDRIGNGKDPNKHLPHVVGTVTNIAGAETGTGTAYMLKRFLHSMNSEVQRREVLLHQAGVDSVDEYSKLRLSHPEKHLKPMPHLFLVIDEFSELMLFSSENDDVDFRTAVTSLARIGRSLGFHIILISQNIENAITPDIRVNSKARLCLKVATRDASREMIGTDLAASPLMPGNGRAYLLIGTGSKFEYFQSAYSGADITRNLDAPVIVTNATAGQEYTLFYNSEAKKKGVPEAGKEEKSADRKKKPQSVEIAENPATATAEAEKAESVNAQPIVQQAPSEEGNWNQSVSVAAAKEEIPPETETDRDSTVAVPETPDASEAEAGEEPSMEKPAEEKPATRSKTGTTQLSLLVQCINECYQNMQIAEPHCIFQQPLPEACFYEYDWGTREGRRVILKSFSDASSIGTEKQDNREEA